MLPVIQVPPGPRTLRDAGAEPQSFQEGPVRRALLPERLLAKLWAAKAGRRLRTTDGRTLRVLYPGRPAPGHGPDFRDALLVLGGRRMRGPVELHRTPAEWGAHGHDHDAAYADVVLHVVHAAEPAAPRLGLPTVVLEADDDAPVASAGADPPLHDLAGRSDDSLRAALRRAGRTRFREHALAASAAVGRDGVEQALYASILEALGYAENRAPFAELAWRLPLERVRALGRSEPEAVRFDAVHGLLRSCTGLGPASCCVGAGIEPMDPRCWRTSGVRPASHPLRRLPAAAALVLISIPAGLRPVLVDACAAGTTALVDALRMRRTPDGTALVGTGRAREMAVGAVLPTLAADAAARGDRRLAREVHAVYERFPALPDNTLTREARRLLGPRAHAMHLSACEHQGLMHLYRLAVA